MEYNNIEADTKKRMENTIKVLGDSFRKIRTGRANSSMVEDLEVQYYGTPTPLKQLANINTPDAKTLSIVPYDKSQIDDIASSISKSELNLTPNTSSDAVIINLPPLTEETRNDFRKQARAEAEKSRVSIRNIRRDAISKIKELEEGEDASKQHVQQIEKITEGFIKNIEDLLEQKEKDLMQV